MNFSSLFGFGRNPSKLQTAHAGPHHPLDMPKDSDPSTQPVSSYLDLSRSISTENEFSKTTWFLPTQAAWLSDDWPLRIMEKSRQVGATKTDAFDSVMKASPHGARFDVWVSSRDDIQARLYLQDSYEWAKILDLAVAHLALQLLHPKSNLSAYVLQFANGRRIYCLSSHPN